MNFKSLVLLLLLVGLGVGTYLYSTAKQTINASANIGATVLPGLEDALNNVNELEITAAGDQPLSTIIRSESGWVIKQRNSYPADISKVRNALLSLAQAKIVEEKTSNKDLYAKLGVEDVSSSTAGGVKATIKYNDQVAALIVGKPGPQINKSRYIRKADSDTSWLIDQKIDLKHQVDFWLQKSLLSIEPSEVAAVKITLLEDNSVLEITNSGDDEDTFEVTNLSDSESQVIAAELHQVTNALSSFQLLDVSTLEEFKDETPSMMVSYKLKSGVVIDLHAYDIDDAHYTSVDVSLSPDLAVESKAEAQEFVDQTQALTSGWVYKIPNVTYDSMYKREADVLAITLDQLN